MKSPCDEEMSDGGVISIRPRSSGPSIIGKQIADDITANDFRNAVIAGRESASMVVEAPSCRDMPGVSEPFYLSDRLPPPSRRLTSRTIWSIWNGCKRLGSFANIARHFAKTVSGLFCSCLHSSMIFWMVTSQSSKRIGEASLSRYLGEERLHLHAFLSTTIVTANGKSAFWISSNITVFARSWSKPPDPAPIKGKAIDRKP